MVGVTCKQGYFSVALFPVLHLSSPAVWVTLRRPCENYHMMYASVYMYVTHANYSIFVASYLCEQYLGNKTSHFLTVAVSCRAARLPGQATRAAKPLCHSWISVVNTIDQNFTRAICPTVPGSVSWPRFKIAYQKLNDWTVLLYNQTKYLTSWAHTWRRGWGCMAVACSVCLEHLYKHLLCDPLMYKSCMVPWALVKWSTTAKTNQ